jgi:hypothetical protein
VFIMIYRNWLTAGLTAGLICLGGDRFALAQEPADPDVKMLQQRVDSFFEGISVAGRTQSAYKEFLAGSPLLKQTEQVDALVARTDQLDDRYGPYRGFEPIAARRVGTDLIFLRYLYKCEQFPVVFYFTFYRAPRGDPPAETSNNWRVIIVRFDTELELLALTPESK